MHDVDLTLALKKINKNKDIFNRFQWFHFLLSVCIDCLICV